jgi:integrase/recombinase XerD
LPRKEFIMRRTARAIPVLISVAASLALIAKTAQISRHISPHSLRHAAITNALDAGVPLRDAQILARHADPRTTEHYDRARGNLDRHGVHFLIAYVAGV